MKRKLFVMIVAVLVICLTAGILLTACKPKDPGSEDEGGGGGNTDSGSMVTATALSNVITYIYDNTYKNVKFDGSNDTTLGIDVELDLVLGGETYTLIAKGNLDIRPEVTSKAAAAEVQDNSELYIGIKKGAKTVMGIGYDVEGKGVDLKPYLYLVSTDDNGENPFVKKVYGMSIAKMMYDNANIEYAEGTFAGDNASASAEEGGMDVLSIVKAIPKLLGSTLFGSTCKVNAFGDGGVQYVFNFDLKNTITGLASGGITDLPDSSATPSTTISGPSSTVSRVCFPKIWLLRSRNRARKVSSNCSRLSPRCSARTKRTM